MCVMATLPEFASAKIPLTPDGYVDLAIAEGRKQAWANLVGKFVEFSKIHQLESMEVPRESGWIYREVDTKRGDGVVNKVIHLRQGERGISFSLNEPLIYFTEGSTGKDSRYKAKSDGDVLPTDIVALFDNANDVLEHFIESEERKEKKSPTRRKSTSPSPPEISPEQPAEEEDEEEKPYYSDDPLDPNVHPYLRPGRSEDSPKVA